MAFDGSMRQAAGSFKLYSVTRDNDFFLIMPSLSQRMGAALSGCERKAIIRKGIWNNMRRKRFIFHSSILFSPTYEQ